MSTVPVYVDGRGQLKGMGKVGLCEKTAHENRELAEGHLFQGKALYRLLDQRDETLEKNPLFVKLISITAISKF